MLQIGSDFKKRNSCIVGWGQTEVIVPCTGSRPVPSASFLSSLSFAFLASEAEADSDLFSLLLSTRLASVLTILVDVIVEDEPEAEPEAEEE